MFQTLLNPMVLMLLVPLCCGQVQGSNNTSSAAFTHRQLTSSLAVTTLAGNGAAGANNGFGTSATFSNNMRNLCFAPDESYLLIADADNHMIRKYDMITGAVSTVAGSSAGYVNNVGTLAKLNTPYDIKIHPTSGDFALIADLNNNRIRELNLSTGAVSTFVGSGAASDANGIGTSASLYGPMGISISSDGSFAVVSVHHGHKVGKIIISTRELSFLAGSSSGYQNGVGSNAKFNAPYFVTLSPDDSYALIADHINHVIRRLNVSSGVVSTYCGSTPGSAGNAVGACDTQARFFKPLGVAFAPDGSYVFVTDSGNHIFRFIDTSTTFMSTLSGTGNIGSANGALLRAQYINPHGVAINSGGIFALVTEYGGHSIRRIWLIEPPTSAPSSLPTSLPSGVPTSMPTSIPSSVPSSVPTSLPSSVPSSMPTSIPSSVPSSVPTSLPSSAPTSMPTSIPSSVPSSVPTSLPSSAPTSMPTSIPSSVPSSLPTSLPSGVPTSLPTSIPSSVPSLVPTSLPSSAPTSMPMSSVPSSLPTSLPSSVPTSMATSIPSSVPRSLPTSLPSSVPTSLPTSIPSSVPSSVPTSLPSGVPTSMPTSIPTCSSSYSDMNLGIKIFGRFDVYGVASSLLGLLVSPIGDVNSDGVDDVLIGAPYSSITFRQAYVIYGRAGGSPDIHLSAFTHKQGFVITGRDADDALGHAASGLGDVNGDGVNDFAISAPFTNLNKGAVYVIYGKAGYRENVDLSALTPAIGYSIFGYEVNGRFGNSVSSVGDVNGDGVADMLLSAPRTSSSTGMSYLVFGRAVNNSLGSIDLSSWSAGMGVIFYGSSRGSQSGFVTNSAGDMNGDGLPDFAIGEPMAESYYGAIRVLLGCSNNCYGPSINLNAMNSHGFTVCGPSALSYFGSTISAAGDINRDGYADLVLGAPLAFDGRGVVYVIYGRAVLSNIDLADLQSSQGYMLRGVEVSSFGSSVAGGVDFNHDGLPDMVIGNPYSSTKKKAVAILGGRRFGSLAAMSDRDGFYMFTSDQDEAGKVVSAVGDFNGDGFVDYAVSASDDSTGGANAGAVYIVYDIYAKDTNVALTHSPVTSPTAYPTLIPTGIPTQLPTNSPTVAPSHIPTLIPTSAPTNKPTSFPSKAPSVTSYPTPSPTHSPTVQPSNKPTLVPTATPTCYPTFSPTLSPTYAPSSAPSSSKPSNTPTDYPSYAPNLSGQPTAPSPQPTLQPSRQPTPLPSLSPTVAPTVQPSPRPTVRPTPLPTCAPTTSPVEDPTTYPTLRPTAAPTPIPTPQPTMKDGYAVVAATECIGYLGSDLNEQFVINVTTGCNITLSGHGGVNVYKFVSSPRSTATITDFKLEVDKIDLSMFSSLRNFRDVNMTAGSVLIHLPEATTLVLLHHTPSDMTEKHFIFYRKDATSSQNILLTYICTSVGFFICSISASLSYCKDSESSSRLVAVAPDTAPDDFESRVCSSVALPSALGRNKIHPILEEPTQAVHAEDQCRDMPATENPDEKGNNDSVEDSYSVSESAPEMRAEGLSWDMPTSAIPNKKRSEAESSRRFQEILNMDTSTDLGTMRKYVTMREFLCDWDKQQQQQEH